VTIQEPTQVASCCNLLAPVRQLSFNRRSARMSFSQVQRVFIVQHYLASRSYLTCQNEFRDTFPYSPVPNKSTISRLVNRFRDTGSVQDRNRSGRPSVLSDDTERGGRNFSITLYILIPPLNTRRCLRVPSHELFQPKCCFEYLFSLRVLRFIPINSLSI
jgi:hypothetical protein